MKLTNTQEDAVRRRDLLAGAAGIGFTLAMGLPTPAVAAGRPVPVDPAAGLGAALFAPSAAQPVTAARLDKGLAAAKADFMAARYGALGEHLPALLAAAEATRDAASGQAREQAQAAVARGYVLATELAFKQHSDIAWATSDRALTAARASGDPVVIGEAARVLGITMRRAGRPGAAVELLRRTAAEVDTGDPAEQAVAATMLLTAAYTAANDGQRSDALDLMGHASSMIERATAAPGRALFTVDATVAQVDSYWVSTFNALGTPDEGVPYAARLAAVRWTSAERAARAATDVARMWHRLGDAKQTFVALRQVEAAAPEEVRRPALRALTASALYGPATVPGLREFAQRTGAI
ncbi:XRE family transcriptional regulator [Kitasatospora sp. NBC_01302]|uniref:XRE family transcriptional regulator n=1 Tax=Kitasatospora sp. NBC_01302 TaxID=2903575 RepID=UPI002E10DF57|nr:XRE family transcriptional regulator [Kitasatospora sp. NBC_01302]